MKLEELLKIGGNDLGLSLTDKQISQFVQYYDILLEWNKKFNLTSLEEEKQVAEKHFLDSLTCGLVEEFSPQGRLIDVGTGAGFPGLPLKIGFPELQVTLLDSLQKRTQFIDYVISSLGLLGVDVLWGRAEETGHTPAYREGYDLCTAKAVAHLSIIAEYCLPLLKIDGFFIAQKASDCEKEVEESKKAIDLLGGEIVKTKSVSLPFSRIERNLVVIKKLVQTPANYPRRSGIPVKRPLK